MFDCYGMGGFVFQLRRMNYLDEAEICQTEAEYSSGPINYISIITESELEYESHIEDMRRVYADTKMTTVAEKRRSAHTSTVHRRVIQDFFW